MKNIFLIILLFIFFLSCKKISEFKILNKYDDRDLVYYIYTNSRDSMEILKYSDSLDQANNRRIIFIYFCMDSLKTPYYYKGKIDRTENCFAFYSDYYENNRKGYHSKKLIFTNKQK
jgi:hypothetical protein